MVGDPFDIDIARRTAGLGSRWRARRRRRAGGPADGRGRATLREFGFRHPVVRTAVYEGQSAARRLAGHARAAAVLAEAGSPLPSSGPAPGPRRRPGGPWRGGAAACGGGRGRGRGPFDRRRLAARREAGGAACRAAHSFCDLAEVLVQSGRLAEALSVAEEGLAFGVGDETDRARLILAAASVERLLGRHAASQRRLSRSVRGEHRVGDGRADGSARPLGVRTRRLPRPGPVGAAGPRRRDGRPDRAWRGSRAGVDRIPVHRSDREADAAGDSAVRAHALGDGRRAGGPGGAGIAIPWALVSVERFGEALAVARRGRQRRGDRATSPVPPPC